jgi:hypothetical protein
MELLEIMLEDYMIEYLEINSGKQNFLQFTDKYADRLLEWKNRWNIRT